MLPPRLPVLSALLLLLLAAGRCAAAALLRGSGTRPEGSLGARGPLEPGAGPDTAEGLAGNGARSPGRESRTHRGLDGHARDPRHKEKFIRHLTGPLYFNPKCRKHFNRVYHSTRDCTIPAYYKRCARLLIRLANSPRCAER